MHHHANNSILRSLMHIATVSLTVFFGVAPANAQTALGTAISYARSNMKISGTLLSGDYDFQIRLFDALTGGNHVASTITLTGVHVTNGALPAQSLDFGDGAFTGGEALWIDVRARQGTSGFKTVGARQEFRPVPFAFALPGLYTIQTASTPNIIGGFAGNSVSPGVVGATICGGGDNSGANVVTRYFGSIGGGLSNTASGDVATVGGGQGNTASGSWSTVGGGLTNTASAAYSTIAGGVSNTASVEFSTVGGGFSNLASSGSCVVAGGYVNTASGSAAAVGGGSGNIASGIAASVPGGKANLASGNYSFAAGRRAKARFDGAFVWADSTDADFLDSGANIFTARASGGVSFYTSANLSSGVVCFGGGGSWSSLSDRNAKEHFQSADPRDILQRIAAGGLPITTWNYKSQDASIRHIGPMAQDFMAAFNVGEDDRHITQADADGVLFAAVQGLHQIIQEQSAQIARQQEQIAALQAAVWSLTALESHK